MIQDAVQDVFVELLDGNGPLSKIDPQRGSGFRAFLHGVTRNIAKRHESTRKLGGLPEDGVFDEEPSVATSFETAWARSLVREAARLQRETAESLGAEATRRAEILRLRFQEGLAIRDIADRWECDPAQVHRDYAKARSEFKAALLEVVGFHMPNAIPTEIRQAAHELLSSLS